MADPQRDVGEGPSRAPPQRSGTTASEREFIRSMIKDDSHGTGLHLPSWLDATTEADPPPSMMPEGGIAEISSQAPTTFVGGTRSGDDASASAAAAAAASSAYWAPAGEAALLEPIPRAYTPSYQSAYSGDAWEHSSALSGLGDLALDDMSSQMDADVGDGGLGGADGIAYDPTQQDSYDHPAQLQGLLEGAGLGSRRQRIDGSAREQQGVASSTAATDGQRQPPQRQLTASSLKELEQVGAAPTVPAAYSQAGQSQSQTQPTSYAELAGGRNIASSSAGVGRTGTLLAAPATGDASSEHSSHGSSVPPGNLNLLPSQRPGRPQPTVITNLQQTPRTQQDLVTPRAYPDTNTQQALFAAALERARQSQQPAALDPSIPQQRSRAAADKSIPAVGDLGTPSASGPPSASTTAPLDLAAVTPQSLFAGFPLSMQKQLMLESGLQSPADGKLPSPLPVNAPSAGGLGAGAPGRPKREDSYDKLKSFLGLDKDEYMRQLKATTMAAPAAAAAADPSIAALRKRANSDIGPRTPSGSTAMTFWGVPTPTATKPGDGSGGLPQQQQQQQQQQAGQGHEQAPTGFLAGQNWQNADNGQASAALAMWRAPLDTKVAAGGADASSSTGIMSPGSSGFGAMAMYSGLNPESMMQVDQQVTVMAVTQESAARSTMDPTLLGAQAQQGGTESYAQGLQGTPQWMAGLPQWNQGAGRSSIPSSSSTPAMGSLNRTYGAPPPSAWRFANMASVAGSNASSSAYASMGGMQRQDADGQQRPDDYGSPGMHSTTSSDGHLVPPGGGGGVTASPHSRAHPYRPRSRTRRLSNASSRSVSSTGSHRVRQSVSNTASPQFDAMGLESGSDLGLEPPVNAQVTTAKTQAASASRRKAAAMFECPFPGCNSTFTRALNLKGHIRSHNDEKPFKCGFPGCDRAFARAHDQKRHQKLHLNIRPHVCEHCGKTFARLDALNRHHKVDGTTCGAKAAELAAAAEAEAEGEQRGEAAQDEQAPPVPPKDSPPRRAGVGRFGGHVL